MDHQLKNEAPLIQSIPAQDSTFIEFQQYQPLPDPRVSLACLISKSSQMTEGEIENCMSARRIQKADREKLRRDRLNDYFAELGNSLDPDRPKHDKITILADTIQLLKDLTSQVEKLKAENATLTTESYELTQEKNDLREEKASLRSDIENLKIQNQQRPMSMVPWAAMDHSVAMAPPYPYPLQMPMPPGPIPMHPSMHPYPVFGNQNPGVFPNPSIFVPYVGPNTLVEQQSAENVDTVGQPGSRFNSSGKQDSGSKSSGGKIEKNDDSNDVTIDLELQTSGSTTDQDLSSGKRKFKKSQRKESVTDESSSSRYSSSRIVQDSSSNSVVGNKNADDLEGTKC